ncbi:FHA domain-containing protein [Plectosphaerella plurivora]|uniref:FHA domain-containing protein n=1 Tax=Plectosphaerella plurivora TaxID=936078 RepID=A0A9P9A8U4_9PEZI|nr:FHA domain-containing protein [Plectosphaerella plurivora]
MWVLEADSNAFGGRRLWLRPGKLYLFGRTASEPGQLAISHQTISRRHMTIQVEVADGDSQRLSTRSTLTIEDLRTKTGTSVGDHKFKGERFVVSEPTVLIKLGNCPDSFRLSWKPIALAFSFSNKTLKPDTVDKLRVRLEQLDVKFSLDYQVGHTTHVVSKKRNTSKGLQALINGKYIVTDAFVDALEEAATIHDPEQGSALEGDFDGNFPDPLQYLPPRGGEPVERPNSAYAPNDDRQEVFDGYTFVFYDRGQYDTLLAPITNGKGKALYSEVKPNETSVDDFILFVKTEAGEKGLGSFEDGSEGRGVVVVRFIPAKGEHMDWLTRFFTDVSQRLDHRPIEQNEFLEAILENNAAILRRALEPEASQPGPSGPYTSSASNQASQPEASHGRTTRSTRASVPEPEPAPASPPPRRSRREPIRRFKGFDDSSDEETKLPIPDISQAPAADSQEALFVSQEVEPMAIDDSVPSSLSQDTSRKRQALDAELLDDIAPGAAAAKRRRIEAGKDPTPWLTAAKIKAEEAEAAENQKQKQASAKKEVKPRKVKVEEIDVLEKARKEREKVDAEAQAEEEDLRRLPDDIDFAAIRNNAPVEYFAPRAPRKGPATREEDIASGRWDPAWNGRKNFKKFRQQGAPVGRPPVKVIVKLVEVKNKAYGIGDDYWVKDGKKKDKDTQRSTESSVVPDSPVKSLSRRAEKVVLSDDSDMEDFIEETPPHAATRGSSRAATKSTWSTNTQSQGTGTGAGSSASLSRAKRSAPASAPSEPPPAKKAKPGRRAFEVQDSDDDDDSDEGLAFRFGRRKKKN